MVGHLRPWCGTSERAYWRAHPAVGDASGVWFLFREGVMRAVAYVVALALGAGALVTVDRLGSSDDAGQVSLAVLVLVSALLGFAAPRWAWVAGVVVGAA